jgi:redox-sensitive bicupin YhaK (pirin superfamily)
MKSENIINIKPLGFLWEVNSPFLFCAHHDDKYPAGNEAMGPEASLRGRDIGQDFTLRDGWRMYHGSTVPGFPAHPHRGFETVTIVLNGMVDHSDSYGQAGRYGGGDVQWMTAGSGLQHSEMFPLLNREGGNPLELFQIWLNLPAARKFAKPHFKMLWNEQIPVVRVTDSAGKAAEVRIIAGNFGAAAALPPAPDSWAADPASHVAIWLIRLAPGAVLELPAGPADALRSLYFYAGDSLVAEGIDIQAKHAFTVKPDAGITLQNGPTDSCLLLLQGLPIDEPVAQYGPFVMNTQQEIRQAIADYRATEFGGWPWNRTDPVHDRSAGRFARYADGHTESMNP